MIPSSRTPEGIPQRCPICGTEANIEVSAPAGDSCCPSCGHLLWEIRDRLSAARGFAPEGITLSSSLVELAGDSLGVVELIMELEEKFEIDFPDDVAEQLGTLGDVIRYIQERRRLKPD